MATTDMIALRRLSPASGQPFRPVLRLPRSPLASAPGRFRGRSQGFSIPELLVVLAIGAVLMAVGTPVLRGALGEQRLQGAAQEVANALAEARREAFRASATARVEVDPATGRLSVFAWDATANAAVERRQTFLPAGVTFNGIVAVTSYTFDTLGRPAALPMTVQVRSTATGRTLTVTVLGTGRVSIT